MKAVRENFCMGFTLGELVKLQDLLQALGYENRAEQFCEDVLSKGLPSQRDAIIARYEAKIRELRELP